MDPVIVANPRDTSPKMLERQFAGWQKMTPAEKLEQVGQMRAAVLRLALAGLRLRHPLADERELELRLAELTLGPELARKVYPEISWRA